MNTLKKDWLVWLIILVPYFFVALLWNEFPDQIPIHFNADGMPDNYTSKFETTQLVLYSVAALFLIIGNYLGNVRHNYFIGIRTPWTLASEEVWIKTHRFAAKVWVVGSLLIMVILPFFHPSQRFILFHTYALILSLLPAGYSYLEFKKSGNP